MEKWELIDKLAELPKYEKSFNKIYPHFCLIWLQIRGSHHPLLSFNNLLYWFTELRETHLLVYYKGSYKRYS